MEGHFLPWIIFSQTPNAVLGGHRIELTYKFNQKKLLARDTQPFHGRPPLQYN